MTDNGRASARRVDRRTFLGGGIAAGGLLAGGTFAKTVKAATAAGSLGSSATPNVPPNILVLLVDQLRFPCWFSPVPAGVGLPPNLARLRQGAVSFEGHYTAANDCTPSRSALLTGLYTHQTGCLITSQSTLNPGFPTWGTMLREQGYQTYWYGKWHLTRGDEHWTAATGGPILESYGFSGGTYPSPNGSPGQGWRTDPHITDQFADFYANQAGDQPWCTTVSLVNPHDIAWWYELSDRVSHEASAARVVHSLPPNFETPEQLISRRKPRLQRSLQDTSAASFGPVPFTGPDVRSAWLPFLDLYVKLQRAVDHQIGRVMQIVQSQPDIAANTVTVFTADHGEYGASHGMRGKGAAAYEEGIRVPLLVQDPRGVLTQALAQPRTQLTSSVDVAPLLLTIASGSDAWRDDSAYAQIADRLGLELILADPGAPGRPYVLHATDEIVTEYASELYAADAPLHVVALRTPQAKYALYSNWTKKGIEPKRHGQESELYDYKSERGRLELDNAVGDHPLEESLNAELELAFADELRATLPQQLAAAAAAGFEDYQTVAKESAAAAAALRKRGRDTERQRASGSGRDEAID